jgi:pimeloyl-ACP methyl ester carboxylesterase
MAEMNAPGGHTARVNGLSLSYYRTSGAKPPLVLAHGLTDDAGCWGKVTAALSERFDVIAYDARGHGFSDAPADGYAPKDHATDLIGLIRALELSAPVLLGHSMGAVTVAVAAATHPELSNTVILEDPPLPADLDGGLSPEDSQRANEHWRRWRDEMAAFQGLSFAEWLDLGRRAHPGWSADEYESWVESKQRVRLNVFNAGPLVASGWHECVRRIRARTLLVTGDPTLGALVQHEAGTAWTQQLAHGSLVRIPNAGHSVHRDQPEAFIEAVQRFLT